MSDCARASRSTRVAIGWLTLAASATVLACYSPKLEDGALGCADAGTARAGLSVGSIGVVGVPPT